MSVFLVDDHEIVRRGIRDLLEAEGDIRVIGEAGQVAGTAEQIVACAPDVAVLDGRLPDGSGIDICRDMLSQSPDIAALFLSSYDDDDALFAAIMAGARGYVLKHIRGDELVSAVRRAARGESLIDPRLTSRVLSRIRNEHKSDAQENSLTDQERRILECIGAGMTNRQIAAKLFLAEKTVKNYVSSLMSKLGVDNRTQAALYLARGRERSR
ncbi:response regulator transcription factor [Paramicrobacterium chengjingii]|uniref:Response regulator transcription factor n=1 Tax=Paramicrobacterium chengjingii TaxID=2769067 RepID=A0ABX6YND8_9MICO|nr:response regulator transcription factor [Microbacterium chengjingii]